MFAFVSCFEEIISRREPFYTLEQGASINFSLSTTEGKSNNHAWDEQTAKNIFSIDGTFPTSIIVLNALWKKKLHFLQKKKKIFFNEKCDLRK